MNKEKTQIKPKIKARIKKYRADQDPEKDEPFEIIELEVENASTECSK